MADSRIEELRRRIERDPGSRLFAQLAEQLRKEGELEEAIGVARAGLQRHPDYPSARLTLGRALLDSGDPAAARTELDAAVKGAPDNILASRLLGEALETLGDLGGAVLQYRKTLEMAPSDRHVEARIQAIKERLGAPSRGKGAEAAEGAPAPRAPGEDLTKPMKAIRREDAPPPAGPGRGEQTPAGATGSEPEGGEQETGLPPTIRIRMPGDPVGGVRAPMPPPPKPSNASTTPPARTRVADRGLPATLPGRGGTEEAKAPPDSDLAPTLPSSKAAEYAAIDESLPPTVPPGSVTTAAGLEAEGGAAITGAREGTGIDRESPAAPEPPPPPAPEPLAPTPDGSPSFDEPSPPAVEPPAPEAPPPEPPVAEPSAPATGRPSGAEPPAEDTSPPAPPATASLEPADKTGRPLSSGTLAELYFQQGLLDRAIAVYREVIAGEPGNEAARARLAEIQTEAERSVTGRPAGPSGEGDGRAARRRVLERTIERLEALLAIVQRR